LPPPPGEPLLLGARRRRLRVLAAAPSLHAARGRHDQRRGAGDPDRGAGLPRGGRGRGDRLRADGVTLDPRGARAASAGHHPRHAREVPPARVLPPPSLVPAPGARPSRAALGGAALPDRRLPGEPPAARPHALSGALRGPPRALRERGARLRARTPEPPSAGARHPALLLRREPGAHPRAARARAGREAGDVGDGATAGGLSVPAHRSERGRDDRRALLEHRHERGRCRIHRNHAHRSAAGPGRYGARRDADADDGTAALIPASIVATAWLTTSPSASPHASVPASRRAIRLIPSSARSARLTSRFAWRGSAAARRIAARARPRSEE